MRFSPSNPIVKLCMRGMMLGGSGHPEDAREAFRQAWDTATDDHERLIAAYHIARQHDDTADRLSWLTTALDLALRIRDCSARSAIPHLHTKLAACHERLGQRDDAEHHRAQAAAFDPTPTDPGPFYHGTRADLQVGDLLFGGNPSNYKPDLIMNHIYFTASPDNAGLAAALAQGDEEERVYMVVPTGSFEDDPNVTNAKFPGNPTRSYRSEEPLQIIDDLTAWERPAPEVVQAWRKRLATLTGEIIN